MSRMFGMLFVGLLFIGIPLLALIGVIALLRKNRSGMRRITSIPDGWRPSEGRVIGGKVEEAVRTHTEDDVFYYPMVLFEYTVQGQRYTGAQGVDRAYNNESIVKKTLAQYPVGRGITVYYDPQKPADARLPMK